MAQGLISTKRLQVDKANATIVGFVGTAAFVLVFSLFAGRALLSQRAYQSRVIAEKTKALKQLKANNQAVEKLVESYKTFVSEPVNIIGGSSSGTADRDGDNAKIVLDALPSKYDFPALATSIEKIIGPTYKVNSISGIDDEVNQSQSTTATQSVEMPFEASVTGNFVAIQDLVTIFQRSIRPIYISKLTLNGNDTSLTLEVTAKTYYQQEKTVNITTKEVK